MGAIPHDLRTEYATPNGVYRGVSPGPHVMATSRLVMRTTLEPMSLAAELRGIVADVDPGVVVFDIETMEARLDRTVTAERFWMRALGIFATLALVLAVVGIYGVVSYAVAQRTHEIGVRMALGAQRTDVLGMVIRQAMVMTAGGVIARRARSRRRDAPPFEQAVRGRGHRPDNLRDRVLGLGRHRAAGHLRARSHGGSGRSGDRHEQRVASATRLPRTLRKWGHSSPLGGG